MAPEDEKGQAFPAGDPPGGFEPGLSPREIYFAAVLPACVTAALGSTNGVSSAVALAAKIADEAVRVMSK